MQDIDRGTGPESVSSAPDIFIGSEVTPSMIARVMPIIERARTLNEYCHLRVPSMHIHCLDDWGGKIPPITPVATKGLSVGLVLASGALMSLVSYIPADIILIVDRNRFIPEWMINSARAMSACPHPDAYESAVYTSANPLWRELVGYYLKPDRFFVVEKELLVTEHFLFGGNYGRSRQALAHKVLIPVMADMKEVPVLWQMLSICLAKQQGVISFANLSNVAEWDNHGIGGLGQNLVVLPWEEEATIFIASYHGVRKHHTDGKQYPRVSVCRGLNEYLGLAKKWTQAYFRRMS